VSAQDHLQLVAGILGFFALMAFIAAVAGIVRGEPSMMASAVLVGLLAGLWFVVRRIRA
jgi:hypothetical protein